MHVEWPAVVQTNMKISLGHEVSKEISAKGIASKNYFHIFHLCDGAYYTFCPSCGVVFLPVVFMHIFDFGETDFKTMSRQLSPGII